MTVAVVCGLRGEARLWDGIPNARVFLHEQREELWLYARAARSLPYTGLISFGTAGGLDPKLSVGSVILGNVIATPKEQFIPDAAWVARLYNTDRSTYTVPILANGKIAVTPADRSSYYIATGCSAIEEESAWVAMVAQVSKLPFISLRVVSDSWNMRLPPAASGAINPNGSTNILNVLRSVLHRPQQLPDLVALGICYNRALNELGKFVQRSQVELTNP